MRFFSWLLVFAGGAAGDGDFPLVGGDFVRQHNQILGARFRNVPGFGFPHRAQRDLTMVRLSFAVKSYSDPG